MRFVTAIGVSALTNSETLGESFPVVRFLDFCRCFAWLVAVGASSVGCYEMTVRPVLVSAIAPIDRCQEVIVSELARIGYHPVERVTGDHAIFSREPTWQHQTPLSIAAPPPLGGVIGLRLMTRDDGRCAVHLQGESYDCLSGSSNSAFTRCELTPGGPPEVDADIRTVVAAFRERI